MANVHHCEYRLCHHNMHAARSCHCLGHVMTSFQRHLHFQIVHAHMSARFANASDEYAHQRHHIGQAQHTFQIKKTASKRLTQRRWSFLPFHVKSLHVECTPLLVFFAWSNNACCTIPNLFTRVKTTFQRHVHFHVVLAHMSARFVRAPFEFAHRRHHYS